MLQELEKLQAKMMLNRYIGRDLSLCLFEDDAVLDQVVEAVLSITYLRDVWLDHLSQNIS